MNELEKFRKLYRTGGSSKGSRGGAYYSGKFNCNKLLEANHRCSIFRGVSGVKDERRNQCKIPKISD